GYGEGGVTKQAQIDYGLSTAQFIPDAEAEATPGSSSAEESRQRGPSQAIPLVQGEQQPGDGSCQSRSPQAIETLSWTHAHRLLHPEYRQNSGDEGYWHAKIKHRWPAPEGYELTAQQRSECRGE